jgi:phosphatidylglycerol lysyltransferase
MFSFNKEKLRTIIKLLFPILLFILVVYELRKMFFGINTDLLMKNIHQLNLVEMFLIVVGGFLAVSPMLYYDFSLKKFLKLEIPTLKMMEYSFISNSFSNLLGLGGLIGASLRTYFYGEYEQDRRKLLTKIGVVTLFSISGLSLLAWVVIFGIFDTSLLFRQKWLYVAIWLIALFLPFYLFNLWRTGKKSSDNKVSLDMVVKLVFASLLEWLFILLALWGLSFIIHLDVSIRELMPILIIAASAGVISMIPGGLGSFDIVFLWGLQGLMVSDEKAIVLLLLYRIGYFLIPFFVGAFLLLKLYWKNWNVSWNGIPSTIVQNVSHFTLAFLVFLTGSVLLLSAAIPGILERLKITEEILSFPIMNLSHQLSVAMGFVLLAVSRGIEYKSNHAYRLAMFVLFFAAIFSLLKGLNYEEAIFIIFVALLLRMSKNHFYRENLVLTWGKVAFDVLLILLITAMYFLIGYINLPSSKLMLPSSIRPYVIVDSGDLFSSAIIGLLIAVVFMVLGYAVGEHYNFHFERSSVQESRVRSHLNTYKGSGLAHLIFLHDKFLFWNQDKDVLFSYNVIADKMVVLGDPLGNQEKIFSSIEEIMETSDRYGYQPVFYQVHSETIPFLHGNGFDFFKLGEEAIVRLSEYSLSGKKAKNLRALKNKFDREGFLFRVFDPPFSDQLMMELKYVSDEWLRGRKEKGFSLGYFDPDYLQHAPIGILKDHTGNLLGFASLMPNYDQNETISVDLMRFLPNSPNGTMDYLFLSLIEWAKRSGYSCFNLGMAPLANVGNSKFSFLSERIAAQIYLHGQLFYHFKGLKEFKEKYADHWEPKYLAYRKKSSLPITMLQVTMLISKRKK